MMERPHDDSNDDADKEEAEAATRRLLRQALLEAVPGIPEGDVDDAILVRGVVRCMGRGIGRHLVDRICRIDRIDWPVIVYV